MSKYMNKEILLVERIVFPSYLPLEGCRSNIYQSSYNELSPSGTANISVFDDGKAAHSLEFDPLTYLHLHSLTVCEACVCTFLSRQQDLGYWSSHGNGLDLRQYRHLQLRVLKIMWLRMIAAWPLSPVTRSYPRQMNCRCLGPRSHQVGDNIQDPSGRAKVALS